MCFDATKMSGFKNWKEEISSNKTEQEEPMSKYILHKADSRGIANHGWLLSRHTFSFANYYNPERVNFGALRVLNDDIVKPAMGFGTHPHSNMEIVSIPLLGALAHKDSTGNEKAIKAGEVQIMSAGKGIYHSEYNFSKTEDVNFLQLWVLPKELNIDPRYGQKNFDPEKHPNQLITVVAPDNPDALWINQDAWFSLGYFNKATDISYEFKNPGNGAYVFIIDGQATINGENLSKRDGLGIYDTPSFKLSVDKEAKFLIIDVPMNIKM